MMHTTRTLTSRPVGPWLAALAIAVAAIVPTTAALAMAGDHGGHGLHAGGPGHRGEAGLGLPFAHPRMAERMLDAVNATAEQRTQIRALTEAARSDLRAQRESGVALREQALAAFAQPTVDARAVEALRQQMLARHDAASKRMTQLMLDVSRVLTPEQRKQLVERMAQRREMMERHQRERHQHDAPRAGRGQG